MRKMISCSGARAPMVRAAIALAPVLAIGVIACSSSTPTPDGGGGEQLCPTTIIEATATADKEGTSSKCHVDGYKCIVGYLCGPFVQQATCVCGTQSDGTQAFSCTVNNPDQTPLDTPVTDPTCASTIPPSDGGVAFCSLCHSTSSDGGVNPCPSDKTTASGTSCSNVGQQCFYSTTCTGQPKPFDVCQCGAKANGDAGLAWHCDLNQCP